MRTGNGDWYEREMREKADSIIESAKAAREADAKRAATLERDRCATLLKARAERVRREPGGEERAAELDRAVQLILEGP